MKSNPPTYAPDRREKKLAMKERTVICFENRAKQSGIPVATLMNAVLDDAVKNDEWTEDDENELHNRIIKNIKHNREIKARMAARR